MDGRRFDAWTMALVTSASRRAALRTLAGTAFGLLLVRLRQERVAADCQQVGQKCDKNGDCCQGAVCKRGTCKCQRRSSTCGKVCCGRGEDCVGSQLDPPAPVCCPAVKACGNRCCPPDRICLCFKPIPGLDPPPDPNDLCRCVCEEGYEENSEGLCECQQPCGDGCCSKDDGQVCCRESDGTLCVRVKSNRQHCGECGNTCPHDRICVGGKCVCPPDAPECGGRCCPPGARCLDGDCVVWEGTCAPGEDACVTGRSTCNDRCNCHTTLEGETRCGDKPEGFSCEDNDYHCDDDAACAWLGVGAFCGKDTGAYCGNICDYPLPNLMGFCRVSCPTISCGQIGDNCARASECCGHEQGKLTCADNGCGDVVCCLQEGEPCTIDSCECCGSLECSDGLCLRPQA